MLRPSAAPRWNKTTMRFLPVLLTSAKAARVKKLGMAVVPTTASALFFRNTRRVSAIALSPLKFRRTQDQASDHAELSVAQLCWVLDVALVQRGVVELFADGVARLLRDVAGKQGIGDHGDGGIGVSR